MNTPSSSASVIAPLDAAHTQSANLLEGNLAQLKTLFPEAFKEGGVDFEVLKQLLGGQVDEREEKYSLNWHGKRRARQIALTPSTGTLRPCPAESVDWDTTQNLMIEGDNLEVLKLLQKSYAGKVKMIYIDPPYNTGKDFVYPDNFTDNIKNYLELTGQTDGEGRKLSSNTEASGRFHTDWLNMMYPRLKLARNLLREDGAIFISIDDNEVTSLRKLCDDIFGEENFIGTFVWRRRASSALAERLISTDHEYVVAYQKQSFTSLGVAKDFLNYSNPDNDSRGPWVAGDLTVGMNKDLRPNQFYNLLDPATGKSYEPNPNRVWAYIPESMSDLLAEKRVLFPADTTRRPMLKRFQNELRSDVNPATTWMTDVGLNTESTKELQELFGQSPFDYSKPTSLLMYLLSITLEKQDLVIDFFAGSATTAHAAMNLNASDGGARRFIMVQLPELTTQVEYKTIAEITKERLRRAATKIRAAKSVSTPENSQLSLESEPETSPQPLDLGFKVFKLDTSNIRAWNPNPDELADTLMAHTEHLAAGRTEADVLYEVLLKQGLDLAVPAQRQVIAGHTVHSVGAGALLVCLARDVMGQGDTSTGSVRTDTDTESVRAMSESSVTAANAEALALGIADWHTQLATALGQTPQELHTRVVLRDSLFDGDVAKTNLTAILRQRGLEDVRSL